MVPPEDPEHTQGRAQADDRGARPQAAHRPVASGHPGGAARRHEAARDLRGGELTGHWEESFGTSCRSRSGMVADRCGTLALMLRRRLEPPSRNLPPMRMTASWFGPQWTPEYKAVEVCSPSYASPPRSLPRFHSP